MVTDYYGRVPTARSHHSAIMIKGNQNLLVYGGRNDQKFNKTTCVDVSLSDIIIFNFKLRLWENVDQYGFKPIDGRWNSSIAYN